MEQQTLKPLSEDELVRLHTGLVFVQAISFNPTTLSDLDDFVSAGRIGLLNAIRNYDHRTKFSTFATTCIRNEIIREVNKDSSIRANKCRPLHDNDFEEQETSQLWELLPDNLTDRERLAVQYRIMEGCTLKEIGDKLGCTKQWAGQILQQAIKKVKSAYG